jgi:galactokinase
MYQVSCVELDYLADAVDNMKSVVGCRMMGGGFGGCTINLVEEQATEDIIHQLKDIYEKDMHLPLTYYVTSIEDGTNILKSLRHV